MKKGITESKLSQEAFDDFGYITKITNPFNVDPKNKTKIYIVAGIRGIGTWGSAECIKKAWRQIYNKMETSNRESNFSALVKIKYEAFDITDIKVISVSTFD